MAHDQQQQQQQQQPDPDLQRKIHTLTDLDLALLLPLLAREHCLLSTPAPSVAALAAELALVAGRTFGLAPALVACHPATTPDDLVAAALRTPPPAPDVPGGAGESAPHQQLADVIIATNLDRAPHAVQFQALELMRTRHLATRRGRPVDVPPHFLFVALVGADSGGAARVTRHLNDFFYVSHWHDPEDGFARLDEQQQQQQQQEEEAEKTRRGGTGGGGALPLRPIAASSPPPRPSHPLLPPSSLAALTTLAAGARLDVDVARYQRNIGAFLRLHRAVAGGVSPRATRHLDRLARALAPLHGLAYVTPALVGLAARKVYPHRLRLVAAPERERSVQWGSDPAAVAVALAGVRPEDVIEHVLAAVPVPT